MIRYLISSITFLDGAQKKMEFVKNRWIKRHGTGHGRMGKLDRIQCECNEEASLFPQTFIIMLTRKWRMVLANNNHFLALCMI
ncbi:hypothetical protein H5410_052885 [Solanum commersonii]|uniref:Uncharacterized protein n=1 Tax=Solanum commersonii TaxID=4109 RepID=A0A9J5X2S7_SOLCO|nr:hypothetical protein H5410_052885 [Solanum commersonii]